MDNTSTGKRLSPRQREIIELAAQGLSDRQIALAIGIKVETVRSYWRELRARFGHTNRAHVIATTLADGSASYPAKLIGHSSLELSCEGEDVDLPCVWQSILSALDSPMVVVWGGEGSVVFINDSLKALIRRPAPYSKCRTEYDQWHGYDTEGRRIRPDEWPISRTLDGQGQVENSLFFRRGDDTWVLVKARSIPIVHKGVLRGALALITPVRECQEPPPGFLEADAA